MFRKLLIVLCLIAANAAAQNKDSKASKTTEKKDDLEMEFRQFGTPMPRLRMIVYNDTSANLPRQDSQVVIAKDRPKKKKKSHVVAVPEGPKKVLTNEDVNNGANLLVMIFNPTCSHCEEETFMLQKNIELFKRSRLLMMATPMMQPYIGDFYKMMNLGKYSDVISVGIDSAEFLSKVFLYQALPQINIYSGAERKLIKTYTGEVSIDTLKKFIE